MDIWKKVDRKDLEYRDELRHFILFLTNTGLRSGSETKGLCWGHMSDEDEHFKIKIVDGKTGADEVIAQPSVKLFMRGWRMIYKKDTKRWGIGISKAP